jgi:formate dehydrogenase subunit delta
MDVNKLIRMANQIAANFDYGTDKERAIAGVLDHVTRFWTLDMKQAIVAYRQVGGDGLADVAAEAVNQLGEKYGAPA